MRIARAPLLAAIVALTALVLAACGGDGDEPNATSTTSAPAATNTPAKQVDVPGRPNAFADYPGVVGIYLTLAGDAVLGAPCLEELVDGWAMAGPDVPLPPEERCLTGNTDADADDEVVVLFTAEPDGENHSFGLLSNVVVFDKTPEGYVAVFQSWTPDQASNVFPQSIVAAEDITGDGNGDLIYTTDTCGAHTCTLAVHVVTGDRGVYSELTPEDGLMMETADVLLEDGADEGQKLIVLHGGTIGSVGAGPQRSRTEAYGWDGSSAFTLLETTYDPSDELYFAIQDADTVFSSGNFSISAQMYQALLDDDSLTETGFHDNELAELSAYALFREGLALLASGDEAAGLAALQQAVDDYPDAVNAGLAQSFLPAFETAGDIHSGCIAVRNNIDANLDAFQMTWEYGYANPPFEPEAFCPF